MFFEEEKETVETAEETKDNSNEDTNEETVEENLDEKDLQIKELEKQIKALQDEINLIKKGAADVMNRNKQLEIDKKYASTGLVSNLLVPISYFEGALKFKSQDESFNNFLKGFEMVYNLLLEQLYNSGLKEIGVKLNDQFDPKLHEVIELIESDEDDNKIVEIIQKGYYFKERVLKPAKVKVSQKIDQKSQQKSNNNENEDSIN